MRTVHFPSNDETSRHHGKGLQRGPDLIVPQYHSIIRQTKESSHGR